MRIRENAALTQKYHAAHEGFTVFETAVVVAIIGLLVVVAMASYSLTVNASRKIVCSQNQRELNNASTVFEQQNNAFAPDLQTLKPYVVGFDTVKLDPGTDTTLSYDPATGRITCPKHPQ